jgi:branched-chain amino acid transport system permease protein
LTATVQQRSSRLSAWRPARVFSPRNLIVAAIVIAVLILAPTVLGAYWTRIFTVCTIFSIAAAGIALLYGRLGLVSLGQVSLIGVGGWITLRVGHAGLPFELALLVAAIGFLWWRGHSP